MSNIMDLWYERASNSPLLFHLYNKDSSNREDDENVVDAMVEHADRFQKLHLSSTSVEDIYGFVTHTPGRLERLESLQLEIGDLQEIHTTIKVFNKAPLLCEVILNVGTIDLVSRLIIPWRQLTTISVVGTAIYQIDMLDVLRECGQLVSGSFRITTDLDNGEIDFEFGADPIVLKYLINLKISLFLPRAFDVPFIAFEKLSLPTLTHLTLIGDYDRDTLLSHASLLAGLRRASRLQHLALLEFLTNHEDLLQILQSTPRLTSLKLVLYPIAEYNPFIKALIVDGQSDVYLPLLESLDIRIYLASERLNVNKLMEMIRSRSVKVSQPLVAYLNDHLRVSLLQPDILQNAQVMGEIEISMHNDDNFDDDAVSLDLS